MDTIEISKNQFENIIQENEQLKRENELLRTGKMQKLYKKILKIQDQLKKGEIYTRADLKF
ncbi:hypothetical protein HOD20_03235 [archaeon]|jgi:hypothetical protein|nr:hypothetical protein [archaeon]MBT4351516.1 hypothetical protein [archaeon]MBT4648637.1 hypothetical protein [archaeon]MBT6822502.1 hypothetical protein [archaeon]MBT7392176.1 hypothetical protein [archaeon]